MIVLTGTLEQIFTYIGFALSFFPILVVVGLFKLRRTGCNKIRLPGFPFTAIIFLTTTLCILILGVMERPEEAIAALLTVSAGIPAYYLFKRYKHT